MVEHTIKEFQKYLNNPSKKELFDGAKKISIQVSLHKIPNLINNKQILCQLPNSLNEGENLPEVCLIVKDIDNKDREYEKTIRKYKTIVEKHGLDSVVKQIIPLKQLNLEFRPHEAKRKLCTSFDVFIADKRLHDILYNGSKLGKEFRKRRKMPFEIIIDESKGLKDSVMQVLNSTSIRLTGNGNLIDIDAFLSTHTYSEALANINAIKAELFKHLPGGEQNIKAIYLKSTNSPAVPIYVDPAGNANEIKLKNNVTPRKIKKAKQYKVKRLEKKAKKEEAAKKAALPTLIKRKAEKKISEKKKIKQTAGIFKKSKDKSTKTTNVKRLNKIKRVK